MAQAMRRRRSKIWLGSLGTVLIIILLLVIFWDWDWFKPLVESEASSALGRKVTLQHFRVGLGGTTTVRATGIVIANPDGFAPPAGSPANFATVDQLVIKIDVWKYLRHRVLSLTQIEVDHPSVAVRQLADGSNNYTLHFASSKNSKPSTPPELGQLIINDGDASVIMPKLKTNFKLAIQTREAPADSKLFTGGEIVVDAKGTYTNAPITGRRVGGALLSLRDAGTPYPVDLHLVNGSTKASLTGTIENPATFAGANLRVSFSGQDMANLYQLTGVPIPATPPFSLTGRLDYQKSQIRMTDIAGKVGSSDLEGVITETPAANENERRMVTADLTSRQVDLTDLAGFLGATPGKTSTPGQTAATKAKMAAAAARPNLLPDTTFNLPKINAANVDLRYHGEHILNKDTPLDQLVVHLVINDGRITVDPLNFVVGTGSIASDFDLNPAGGVLHTKANVDFRHLQLARLMKATHAFAGDGVVGGTAHLTGTGNSVALILGHGNGGLQLFMQHGGDVSALLVDLAGLQVGDAVLSALGVPNKANIQCLVTDFTLTDGTVNTNALLLATTEANILGSGTIDLNQEKLNLRLNTEATHFSIGSLSTPINIGGTLKHPSVLPAAGPLAARAVPAVGLGILFPPLALLPTIRLGLGDKNACADTLNSLNAGQPHNPK
jgi:uncharacterized protein involved in outer membrane biogenesis